MKTNRPFFVFSAVVLISMAAYLAVGGFERSLKDTVGMARRFKQSDEHLADMSCRQELWRLKKQVKNMNRNAIPQNDSEEKRGDGPSEEERMLQKKARWSIDTLRRTLEGQQMFLLDNIKTGLEGLPDVYRKLRERQANDPEVVADSISEYQRGFMTAISSLAPELSAAMSEEIEATLCSDDVADAETIVLARIMSALPEAVSPHAVDCVVSKRNTEDAVLWSVLDSWRNSELPMSKTLDGLAERAIDERTIRRLNPSTVEEIEEQMRSSETDSKNDEEQSATANTGMKLIDLTQLSQSGGSLLKELGVAEADIATSKF